MKKKTVIWLMLVLIAFSMILQGCGDDNGVFGDGGGKIKSRNKRI